MRLQENELAILLQRTDDELSFAIIQLENDKSSAEKANAVASWLAILSYFAIAVLLGWLAHSMSSTRSGVWIVPAVICGLVFAFWMISGGDFSMSYAQKLLGYPRFEGEEILKRLTAERHRRQQARTTANEIK
jgi:hypothetical protein